MVRSSLAGQKTKEECVRSGELTSHSLISNCITIIALGLPEGQHCLAFTVTTIRGSKDSL